MIGILGLATSVAAAPKGRPAVKPRALSAADIDIDVSPAAQVLSLWASTGRQGSGDGRSRAKARRIAHTLPIHTLGLFFHDRFRCVMTEADVARAIELPDSGCCGFGMDPAYQNRDSLAALANMIAASKTELVSRIAANVSGYLPTAQTWKPIRIWFVIASQTMFDAATLRVSADGDSAPVIFINLTEVLSYGATTRERLEALRHVLGHETFHAGLHEVEPQLSGWANYLGEPTSGFAYIRSVIVDEGVAHYIDWRDRSGVDSMFTWKPSAREVYAFAQLAAACRRLKQPDDARGDRMETIQLAGNGPLWSKYGAISGMFAAHRIEMGLGRGALRRAIEGGPDEFLRTYRDLARRRPWLGGIPADLISSQ